MSNQNCEVYQEEIRKINGEIRKIPRFMNPWDYERLHRLQLKRQWYGNLMMVEEEKENKK